MERFDLMDTCRIGPEFSVRSSSFRSNRNRSIPVTRSVSRARMAATNAGLFGRAKVGEFR